MCGIAAILAPNEALNPELIKRALPVLKHRGPDEHNSWTAHHGHISLGHTRLSIIGLSNGRQPMSNETGDIWSVVNGEFYHFEQIRNELRAKGHQFRTDSDSEIALHLYEDMGTTFMRRLRGEFAVVLWDERRQSLTAVRDRFGIKPLYYANVNGKTYIASEIKALFALGVRASWDREIMCGIHYGFVQRAGRTIFDGIYAIPPGHMLTITKGESKITRYWDFDYPPADSEANVPTFSEAVQLLREKLVESVRLRLRSDVPVGVYLSGGIDSGAILGLASKLSKQPLRAFTLAFNHAEYTEENIAREMAELAGAEFCPIKMISTDLAHHLEAAVIQGETLITNTHAVAKFLLSRVVHEAGYKVVLTGEGADEVFGGYAFFKKDMILHNTKGQDQKMIQLMLAELQRTNTVSRGLMLAEQQTKVSQPLVEALGFIPAFLEAFFAIGAMIADVVNWDYFGNSKTQDHVHEMLRELDFEGQVRGREPVHQSMYLFSKTFFPNYVLTLLGDRMEMADSVEGRVPFLDHELVELAVKMPVAYKIKGLTEKYVLREAARDVLTDSLYKRQKHPFQAPPSTLNVDDPLYTFVQDTLRSGIDSLPFYNKSHLLAILDKIPHMTQAQKTGVDAALMVVVSSVILNRHFNLS